VNAPALKVLTGLGDTRRSGFGEPALLDAVNA